MSIFGFFLLFAKMSFLTFGGGYAMVPLFQYEIVTKHAFMSAADFANLVAIAQITPGPIGFNSATFVGMAHGGTIGAIAASLGVMVPSFTITLVVAMFLARARNAWWMERLMKGVRPCVFGIIAAAVVFFADTSVFTAPFSGLFHGEAVGVCWQGAVVFIAVIACRLWFKKLNPVWALLLAAVLGWSLFLV